MNKDKGIKALCCILLIAAAAVTSSAFAKGFTLSAPNVNILPQDNGRYEKTVYLLGAVQREGAYRVKASMTYRELFVQSGLFTTSYLGGYDYDKYIDFSENLIIINYSENGDIYSCANINTASAEDFEVLCIGNEISEKITEYRKINGNFNNKYQLAEILGYEQFLSIEHKVYCY